MSEADELAERIEAEIRKRAGVMVPTDAHTIAADVAREWMEGKAVMDGKVWRLVNANDLPASYGGIFTLIPIDQEDTE